MAEKFALIPIKMNSAEYTKMLNDSWPQQTELLTSLGLIKKPATAPR